MGHCQSACSPKRPFFSWQLRQVSRLYGVSGYGLVQARLDLQAWRQGMVRWERLQCLSCKGDDLDYHAYAGTLEPPVLALPKMGRQALEVWLWPLAQEMHLGRNWGQGLCAPPGVVGAFCAVRWIPDPENGWALDDSYFPPVVRLGASEHWRAFLQALCLAIKNCSESTPQMNAFVALFPWLLEAEPLECWREFVRFCLIHGACMEELPRYHRNNHAEWVNPMRRQIQTYLVKTCLLDKK